MYSFTNYTKAIFFLWRLFLFSASVKFTVSGASPAPGFPSESAKTRLHNFAIHRLMANGK